MIKNSMLFRISIPVFSFFLMMLSPNQILAEIDSLQRIFYEDTLPDTSRFKAINELSKKKVFDQPSEALELSKLHYTLALQKQYPLELANAMSNKVQALKVMGSYEEALQELKLLIDMRVNLKDSIGLADSYRIKGKIYHYQSKYLDAVKYLTKSLNIYQELELERSQSRVFVSLATVYYEINNFELASEYFGLASNIAEKLAQTDVLCLIAINHGFLSYETKDYYQAIAKAHKTVSAFIVSSHHVGLADGYYLLAQSHLALNQIDSALHYVEKSLDINISLGNTGQIIPTKLLLANISFKISPQKALQIAEELQSSIDASYGYKYLTQIHHLLYRCHKHQGNLPLALAMHERYTVFNDSLLIEEDDIAITRQALQTKHEMELLNKELENEKYQSQLEYNQLKRTFAIVLVSLFIILLTVFYAQSKILKQRQEKNEALKEIEELKKKGNSSLQLITPKFQLNRKRLEETIKKKINETDWKVLQILLDDPVISNKDIAKEAFLTVDGIGSCLRRMYVAFDIKESKYKKISLIMKAIKLSDNS